MKTTIRFTAILACAWAALATQSQAASVTTEVVTLDSKSLGRQTEFVVARPEPLEAGRKYPVLYLLHGATGGSRDWTSRTAITSELADRNLIVVMPDGGPNGWYLDSPVVADSQYESHIIREIIPEVDKKYPTKPSREGRAIAGLSMGGHGALSLVAKHPDLFSSASSMSGILRLQNHAKKWRIPTVLGEMAGREDVWASHSVYSLVDSFTSGDLALLFDTGTSDSTGCVVDNRQVHERLTNRGIQHVYNEFPGQHDWNYWSARLPEHLDFHLGIFAKRDKGTTVPAGANIADRFHKLYSDRCLSFEKQNTEVWQAGTTRPIVLLGSSTFQGFKEDKLLPDYHVANRGISADRIGLTGRGLLHRLYCSAIDMKPRAVLINNGTNDLGALSKTGKPTVEEVSDCFGEVVARIREGVPDCHVFIVSCHATRDNSARIAPFIAPYNTEIRKLAEAGDPMIHYVDHYTDTVGADGLLKPEYSRDGLHLNDAGYEILRNRMVEAMKKAGINPDR